MLQVAAATNCKHYYGVEKADIPATYAEVTAVHKILNGQKGVTERGQRKVSIHPDYKLCQISLHPQSLHVLRIPYHYPVATDTPALNFELCKEAACSVSDPW